VEAMEQGEIRDKVRKVFSDVFGIQELDFNKKQDDFENWDSLAHMQLVNGIENEFCLQFEMEEIVDIQTPEGFVCLVEKKLK
jgi:acyl carrier protein